jgi:hypothetical protein
MPQLSWIAAALPFVVSFSIEKASCKRLQLSINCKG